MVMKCIRELPNACAIHMIYRIWEESEAFHTQTHTQPRLNTATTIFPVRSSPKRINKNVLPLNFDKYASSTHTHIVWDVGTIWFLSFHTQTRNSCKNNVVLLFFLASALILAGSMFDVCYLRLTFWYDFTSCTIWMWKSDGGRHGNIKKTAHVPTWKWFANHIFVFGGHFVSCRKYSLPESTRFFFCCHHHHCRHLLVKF